MRKIQILGIALVALFAFSAVVASMASAETTLLAEWLVTGAAVTTAVSTEGTGKIILEDSKVGLKMECEGVLDGFVNANGADETTEVLNKAGEATSLTKKLTCTGLGGCSKAEAAPEELPWKTQAELLESGAFGDIVTLATYWSKCTVLGINTEEECMINNGLFIIENGPSGVIPKGKIEPNGNCTVGGTGAAGQEFLTGDLLKTLSGTLEVAE